MGGEEEPLDRTATTIQGHVAKVEQKSRGHWSFPTGVERRG